jgi:hypothetical protein
MDVQDEQAAQRESQMGCISGEVAEWIAVDHRIDSVTGAADGTDGAQATWEPQQQQQGGSTVMLKG